MLVYAFIFKVYPVKLNKFSLPRNFSKALSTNYDHCNDLMPAKANTEKTTTKNSVYIVFCEIMIFGFLNVLALN